MLLTRLFIGKYEPIRRPTNAIDEGLLGRIEKARQELTARGKDVVSLRDGQPSFSRTAPDYARGELRGTRQAEHGSVNRAA